MSHLRRAIVGAVFILLCSAAAAQDADEILIAFHPSISRNLRLSSTNNEIRELVRPYGLGAPLRRERSGAFAFAVPDGTDLTNLLTTIRHSPAVIAASTIPTTSRRMQIQTAEVFGSGTNETAVLGLIVKYRSSEFIELSRRNGRLSAEEMKRVGEIIGTSIVGNHAMSGDAFVLDFESPLTQAKSSSLARILEGDPSVEHVSLNELVRPAIVPNDSSFGLQWSLAASAVGINAPAAWNVTTGSSVVVVAVVDTGILPHPEFGTRVLDGYDFISDPNRSNDGNGRDADATDPGDWVPAGHCGAGSPAADSSWHGTHVAGIIAATGNNGAGIAGLDWSARILPVRVLGRCGGTVADITDGIRWASGLPVPGVPANTTPARAINVSIGGHTPCWLQPIYQEAAIEVLVTGAALVVAAGNDFANAANYSPAGCAGVITIGAAGPTGDLASYSNYGSNVLDLSAPGGDINRFGDSGGILSTYATGAHDRGSPTLKYLQGTSMAAPHVTGTISLMLSANPGLTIAQMRDIIRGTARPFTPGSICGLTGQCGLGLLQAGAAVSDAKAFSAVKWNFTDHWYNAAESGWGVQVTAQGETQFVTWYTYGLDGNPLWFTMVLNRAGQDIFTGDVFQTTGVPLPNINGGQASTSVTKVGTAVMFYYGFFEAVLVYDIKGVSAVKPIQRLEFAAPLTVCVYSTAPRNSDTNYQDIWWNPQESGWGINLTHQGNTMFATWFTYGPAGQPLWLLMVANRDGPTHYSGRFQVTTGIPFDRIDGTQAFTTVTDVGSGALTFVSGDHARFDYNVFGFSGSKSIERQVFGNPVDHCVPRT